MYLPYSVAVAVMSGMFFIILNTVFSKSVSNMSFGGTMQAMLLFGLMVMGLFTCGYLLYLNSFLTKNRKKEFGLYGILGLEKRHVARIILFENLQLNFGSLLAGLVGGTVFGKLAFMGLMALIQVAPGSEFNLSPWAYLVTAVCFIAVFLCTSVYNQFQVRLASPINLLRAENRGEKKLRGVAPLTVLGLLCVGGGYFCAITSNNMAFAIALFWPAVILVIIGTNLLFLAGSQFVLGAIRKNPGLYYRPRVFVSVSGLVHRMKQNAAGLANICILSTMVLVTISGVCALYFGQDEMNHVMNPNDYQLEMYYDKRLEEPDMRGAMQELSLLAAKSGYTLETMRAFNALRDSVALRDGQLYFKDENAVLNAAGESGWDWSHAVYILTLDDYNAAAGANERLEPDEILLVSALPIADTEEIRPNGARFRVKALIAESPLIQCKNADRDERLYIVARDNEAADAVRYAINPGIANDPNFGEFWRRLIVQIDFDGGSYADRAQFAQRATDILCAATAQVEGTTYSVTSADEDRANNYGMYGGLLFLGLFFALLFLVNTVLIMYFKQVSEGYEDRARYEIMRKVGMSDAEVRGTINGQVLIVFFLPLLVALMHIFAAAPMLTQILSAFQMTNNGMTLLCIAVTSAVYAFIYTLVFRFTARTYYRIVR